MLAVVLNSSSCGRCFQPLTISECWKLVFPYNLTNCNAELNLSDICEYDLGGCDDANLTNDLNNCLGNLDVYRIVPCKAETLPQLNFTCSDGCEISPYFRNDNYCDCSDCSDEDNKTCASCGGCPTECDAWVNCDRCFSHGDCPVGFFCDFFVGRCLLCEWAYIFTDTVARAEERLIGGDYCLLPLNCDSAQFEANCPSLASGCQNHTDCAEGGYCTRQDHTDYTGFGDCRPCARADYKYSIGSACDAMNNDCCSASFQATCPTAPLQCEDACYLYGCNSGAARTFCNTTLGSPNRFCKCLDEFTEVLASEMTLSGNETFPGCIGTCYNMGYYSEWYDKLIDGPKDPNALRGDCFQDKEWRIGESCNFACQPGWTLADEKFPAFACEEWGNFTYRPDWRNWHPDSFGRGIWNNLKSEGPFCREVRACPRYFDGFGGPGKAFDGDTDTATKWHPDWHSMLAIVSYSFSAKVQSFRLNSAAADMGGGTCGRPVSWTLTGKTCQTAVFGASDSNSKTISFDGDYICPSSVDDNFLITQTATQVTLTRVADFGWWWNQEVRCCSLGKNGTLETVIAEVNDYVWDDPWGHFSDCEQRTNADGQPYIWCWSHVFPISVPDFYNEYSLQITDYDCKGYMHYQEYVQLSELELRCESCGTPNFTSLYTKPWASNCSSELGGKCFPVCGAGYSGFNGSIFGFPATCTVGGYTPWSGGCIACNCPAGTIDLYPDGQCNCVSCPVGRVCPGGSALPTCLKNYFDCLSLCARDGIFTDYDCWDRHGCYISGNPTTCCQNNAPGEFDDSADCTCRNCKRCEDGYDCPSYNDTKPKCICGLGKIDKPSGDGRCTCTLCNAGYSCAAGWKQAEVPCPCVAGTADTTSDGLCDCQSLPCQVPGYNCTGGAAQPLACPCPKYYADTTADAFCTCELCSDGYGCDGGAAQPYSCNCPNGTASKRANWQGQWGQPCICQIWPECRRNGWSCPGGTAQPQPCVCPPGSADTTADGYCSCHPCSSEGVGCDGGSAQPVPCICTDGEADTEADGHCNCVPCKEPGFGCGGGSNLPFPCSCSPGFSDEPDRLDGFCNCVPCKEGYFCLGGAELPQECLCEYGSFVPANQSTCNCKVCKEGLLCSGRGAPFPCPCEPGSADTTADGACTCEQCQAGYLCSGLDFQKVDIDECSEYGCDPVGLATCSSPAINQRKCECPYGFKSSLFHGSGGEAILTGNEVFGNCSDQSCVTGAEACRLQGDKHAMCYIPRESILGFYRCACSTRQYFYDGPDGTGSCEVVVSANPPPSFTKWLYIIAAVLGGVCLVVILINKCKFPNAESLVMVSVFFSFLDVASDILFVVAASPAFDSIIRHLFIPSIVFVILPLGLNIVAAYRVYTALQRDNKEFQKWQEKNEKGGGLFMFLCAINTELGLVMDSKLLGMQIFHAPIPSAVAYQLEWLGIVQNVFEDLPQLIIQGIALTALTSAGEGADNIALVSLALSTLSLLWGGLGRLVSLSKSLYGETSKQSRTRRGSHLSRYPTSQKAIDDVKTVVNGTDCEAVDAQSSTGPEAPTHLPSEPSKRGLRITEEMQEPVAAAGKVEDRNMPQLTLNQANGDADSDVSTKVLESGTTGNGSSITVGTLTQGNLNHHDSDTAAAVGPWREGGKNVLAVSRTQIASPSVVDGSVTNLNKSKISKREDEILQMVEIQLAAVARAKAQRK